MKATYSFKETIFKILKHGIPNWFQIYYFYRQNYKSSQQGQDCLVARVPNDGR
jgi:hypothetical protein